MEGTSSKPPQSTPVQARPDEGGALAREAQGSLTRPPVRPHGAGAHGGHTIEQIVYDNDGGRMTSLDSGPRNPHPPQTAKGSRTASRERQTVRFDPVHGLHSDDPQMVEQVRRK